MGYTTQEVDSLALSTLYPAYYKEQQIHNWGPVDIVITDHTGKQTVIPKWPRALAASKPFVEIYQRGSGEFEEWIKENDWNYEEE